MSWTDLGKKVGLTPPAAAERAAKLEARGVINGFAARLNPGALGLGVTAFIEVTLQHPRARSGFVKKIRTLPAVLECHHVAGDFDYLLKARVAATRDLERLVSDVLKSIRGLANTRTTVVLGTAKENADVALAAPRRTKPAATKAPNAKKR